MSAAAVVSSICRAWTKIKCPSATRARGKQDNSLLMINKEKEKSSNILSSYLEYRSTIWKIKSYTMTNVSLGSPGRTTILILNRVKQVHDKDYGQR